MGCGPESDAIRKAPGCRLGTMRSARVIAAADDVAGAGGDYWAELRVRREKS